MITENLRHWSRFACEMHRLKKIFPEYAAEFGACVLQAAEKLKTSAELESGTAIEEIARAAENLRLCRLCGFPLEKAQRRFCSKICHAISRRRFLKTRYSCLNLRGKIVYLHRIIWEKNNGRRLRKGEVVHHVNENPRDNRPANLQAMTISEHNALHGALRRNRRRLQNGSLFEF